MASWNWELPSWPRFRYDPSQIAEEEREFLLELGTASAYLKTVDKEDEKRFVVEILSLEGVESAKIEGEVLDRMSVQSSIQRHFGLLPPLREQSKEAQMAQLLCSVYDTAHEPLTHELLFQWHNLLFQDSATLSDKGKYRSHEEPMQIVSNRYGDSRIFFEAPPSKRVFEEMSQFIAWFNTPSQEPLLGRASIAHVYFESIHPFEDGNGRIGRALVEKMLSRAVKRPILLSLSHFLEQKRKDYYAKLGECNRTLEVDAWVGFFTSALRLAQSESMKWLRFLIQKSKLLSSLEGRLNERQMKVLFRMFEEGPKGFQGGLSSEKYIKITKTTRATATRDLADLVEKGALTKQGDRRHTRYFLSC